MPDASGSSICAFHLAWAPLGIEPFGQFLSSYERHPAGSEHRLCVLFNGFASEAETGPYRDLLGPFDHVSLTFDEPMMDIQAYLTAARRVECEFACFLNSYSVILDSGWLSKLHGHASRDPVGLVGATGTYESHYTSASVRPRLYAGRNPFKWPRAVRYWRGHMEIRAALMRRFEGFAPFPNPHLRTNAFMIRRDLLNRLDFAKVVSKDDAYRFESSKEGLTRRVQGTGREVLIVGRDGRAYGVDDWPKSRTFRLGDQSNLLVSDNRTREFDAAPPEVRQRWARMAWGSGPLEADGAREGEAPTAESLAGR